MTVYAAWGISTRRWDHGACQSTLRRIRPHVNVRGGSFDKRRTIDSVRALCCRRCRSAKPPGSGCGAALRSNPRSGRQRATYKPVVSPGKEVRLQDAPVRVGEVRPDVTSAPPRVGPRSSAKVESRPRRQTPPSASALANAASRHFRGRARDHCCLSVSARHGSAPILSHGCSTSRDVVLECLHCGYSTQVRRALGRRGLSRRWTKRPRWGIHHCRTVTRQRRKGRTWPRRRRPMSGVCQLRYLAREQQDGMGLSCFTKSGSGISVGLLVKGAARGTSFCFLC